MKRFFLFSVFLFVFTLLSGCYTQIEVRDKTYHEAAVADSAQTTQFYTLSLHNEWYPYPYPSYPYYWRYNRWNWYGPWYMNDPWHYRGFSFNFYWDTHRFGFWNSYPWYTKPKSITPYTPWFKPPENPKPESIRPPTRLRDNTGDRSKNPNRENNMERPRGNQNNTNPPRERIQNTQPERKRETNNQNNPQNNTRQNSERNTNTTREQK